MSNSSSILHKVPPPQIDLLRDPIPQILRQTSIPAITGMVFGTLYNIVDTIYAGLYSTEALAAFTLSFPIFFLLLLAIAIGFSNGLKTVIAHALGRGNHNEIGCLIAQGIPLAIGAGLLVNFAAYIGLSNLLNLFESTATSKLFAFEYLSVIFLGGISFNILYALIAPLGAIGDTRTVRNGEIVGALLNMVLNPILMFGWFGLPALGIAGLALSTVLIWSGFACYVLWRLYQSTLWPLLCLANFRPKPRLWKTLLIQAIPSIVNMLRVGAIFAIFTAVMSRFGTEVLAGYGIGFRIEGLIILPVVGLNAAAVALVAQNYGANDYLRVHSIYRYTLGTGLAMMLFGAILLYVFAPALAIPFSEDLTTRAYAVEYLRIEALGLPSIAIINLAICIMQGMQRTMLSVWILIVTQAILPGILLPYVAEHHDYTAVWWTMVGILWLSALCMLAIVWIVMQRWRQTHSFGTSSR